VPRIARAYWLDLAWYGIARGHVLIGRGMKQLWRSHDTFPGGRRVDVNGIALGARRLAFSFSSGGQPLLFLARYGGREHLVARGELPVAFTGGGLVTWRQRGETLLLRTATTARVLARAVDPQLDRGSGIVVFRSRGALFAFDGARIRNLASLRRLGVTGPPQVEPLGRSIAVHDRKRVVVVGYDGRLLASATLPRSRNAADGVASSLVANAEGTAVAYSVTSGNRHRETVYLLALGARKAAPLLGEKLTGENGCGAGAWLAWRGRWLLFSAGTQQNVVVDTSGQVATRKLGAVIAKLPGFRPDGEGRFDVDWA